ncbi:MAG: hypothetical protein EBU84_05645 [Actinobacteria bacterium]|nr:hypothetical protein [Actinomycetota bacterium]
MFEHMEIPPEARPVLIFRDRTIAFGFVYTDGGRLPLAPVLETWHERFVSKYVCVGEDKGVDTLAATGPGPGSIVQKARKYGVTSDIRRLVAIENELALRAWLDWPAP